MEEDSFGPIIFVVPEIWPKFEEWTGEIIHASIDWGYANLDHENVLKIPQADLYKLQDVWELINEVNGSMIGPDENGMVYLQENKILILKNLQKLHDDESDWKKKRWKGKIMRLLEISIRTEQVITFHF